MAESSEAGKEENKPKKVEIDERVKKAFDSAAKKLLLFIKYEGNYVYIDQECPTDIKAKIKKSKSECSA